MKTLIALAALLLTIVPAQAQTAKPGDITGKWTGTMTRTAPDGQSQSINFMFDIVQKGKVLTGTVGPSPERQWPLEKGASVDGKKVIFKVVQPDNGALRTFTLELVKDRLQGEMLAELNGQSFTAKVDAGRAKATPDVKK